MHTCRLQIRCLAISIPLLVLPLLSGCYGKRLTTLEVRTARIEDQVIRLGRMHTELGTTVEALNRLLEEEVRLARSGRAGSEERLREIQRLLQVLASRVDESREQYSELKDVVRYGGAAPAPLPAADSVATSTPQGPRTTGNLTPRQIYDGAYQDLTRGNHGLALMGFQELLSKFPDSELADNAQYWIGESYYAQKDYRQALEEFAKTPASYPQGDKVPAALLKMGFCQQQIGDANAARNTFEKLLDDYPDSEEARLARARLEDL